MLESSQVLDRLFKLQLQRVQLVELGSSARNYGVEYRKREVVTMCLASTN